LNNIKLANVIYIVDGKLQDATVELEYLLKGNFRATETNKVPLSANPSAPENIERKTKLLKSIYKLDDDTYYAGVDEYEIKKIIDIRNKKNEITFINDSCANIVKDYQLEEKTFIYSDLAYEESKEEKAERLINSLQKKAVGYAIKKLCETNNITDIKKFTLFYTVMIDQTNSMFQRIYNDEQIVNAFINDKDNLVERLIIEVKAPELLQVAVKEDMNVMSLYNNIKGTLATCSVKETAKIYKLQKESISFVKDYEL